ncbi:MAG: protein translocase subunit SecD [Candidatus Bipolaricaulota bacterium]
MRRNDWVRVGVVGVVMLLVAGALVPPLIQGREVINLGLDLRGGVRLMLEAQDLEEMDATERRDTVDRLVQIFRQRVDQYGLANVELRPVGQDRVEVRIPGAGDPEEAQRLIGQTALLEFRKVLDSSPNRDDLFRAEPTQKIMRHHDDSQYHLVEGQPMLTGEVLDHAEMRVGGDFRQPGPYIQLEFNRMGAERFVEVVQQLQVGDQLAVVLDDVVYSAPQIQESIKEAAQRGWREVQDTTTITGQFTADEARLLAVVLRSGALPTEVQVIEERTVGPTLGADAIRRGTMAIAISFVLVLLYMPVYYRWLGLVADAALIMNMLILLSALRAFGATLTLPGIAGVILTIGMTVDANVIIFERIKEERRAGKAGRAAVVSGFGKSMSALIDANITTLITAMILFTLGTGPVEGFAITLGLGVAGSLFCALVVSRVLLELTGIGERVPVKVPSST